MPFFCKDTTTAHPQRHTTQTVVLSIMSKGNRNAGYSSTWPNRTDLPASAPNLPLGLPLARHILWNAESGHLTCGNWHSYLLKHNKLMWTPTLQAIHRWFTQKRDRRHQKSPSVSLSSSALNVTKGIFHIFARYRSPFSSFFITYLLNTSVTSL